MAPDNNKSSKNKRAQEEAVGFVLIIVLVAVIFTVFLGIMIHNSSRSNDYSSTEYSQYLSALMEVNTPCIVFYPAYAKVSDLIGYCFDSKICSNGNSSCAVLNSTLNNALKATILYGDERAIKGYYFSIQYSRDNSTAFQSIIKINKGLCNSSLVGADYPIPHYPGTITAAIKICS